LNYITLYHPDVEEEIYVQFPEGLTAPMYLEKNKDSQLALHLKKALHRLKQAPRSWNEAVDRTLKRLKFIRCKSDPVSTFRKVSFAIIAITVDDLILTLTSDELLQLIKQELMANYKMTDFGDLSWCLGIQVTQGKDAVLLPQSIYVTKLLERFDIPTALNFKKELC